LAVGQRPDGGQWTGLPDKYGTPAMAGVQQKFIEIHGNGLALIKPNGIK